MPGSDRAVPELLLPNLARVYDFLRGGSHNFATDRAFAERVLAAYPQVWRVATANRAFLRRMVQACLQAGVRQFLDLGSGIPTADTVHQIARAHDPGARVAYVDVEPVAVSHSQTVLGGLHGVSITEADLRQPEVVLAAPGLSEVLDFAEPVGLLTVAVLQFVAPDEDPAGILARYRAALSPGSMWVCSHVSTDFADPAVAESARRLVALTRDSAQPAYARDRTALAALADESALLDPGIVDIARWRPEPDQNQDQTGVYGLVGRLR